MHVRISMERPEESAAIKSLYQWLAKDPDVARTAELSLTTQAPEPGSMGWDMDTINVVLSNSLAGLNAVLAAVTVWRQNRPTGSGGVRVDTVEDPPNPAGDSGGDDRDRG
ncbi:hypothetical protein [Streptomyces sp. NPDC002054]|uniref:effector-associated constant component EACC1 n=1 Tax=Streptomyces sp. NPDC002054 TaxID=3154663 RepID=UPI003321FA19